MVDRSVALVTGASRGIGKALAVWMARAGFDVAITARTVEPGERREHSSTLRKSNTEPLPGSLTETAALIEAEGRAALVVPADLLDRASVKAAAESVLATWGRIDVLINNARYIGPGHMDWFMDTPIELLDIHLQANVVSQLLLTQLALPGMIERGDGTIINITSGSAYGDPTKPAGQGGWGMGYGISKGAFQRIAGFINAELGPSGIRCFNVNPGSIETERIGADMAEFGIGNVGVSADVVGAVVAWLATDRASDELLPTTVEAQYLCVERNLLPGFTDPALPVTPIRYEESGTILIALENQFAKRREQARRVR
jgi:NAD(P)-dependent dehydrogenase (short-subunit alcohol dehydrogenase family)